MMRKNILFKIIATGILISILTACTQNLQESPHVTDDPLVGRLTFAGSTTVQPLANQLGDIFIKDHPQVTLEIAAGGSTVGIQAIHDGAVDIGMASRALKPEEAEGIEQYQIAVDVIAIIVNPVNPVQNLTQDQLRAIYLGEITNWNQVGGENLEIVPVIREESSGTRGAFDELMLDKKTPSAPHLTVGVTAGDVAAIITRDEAAIGYVGFGNIEDVKILAIEGVEPSVETARDGSYRITRPLLLLTGPLSQTIAYNFIDFVLSEVGQSLVEEFGWIPLK
jgi:phosphate transport system substrate-binding protein